MPTLTHRADTNGRSWGGLAWLTPAGSQCLHATSQWLTHSVSFCMFKSTFVSVDLSAILDENASQVSFFSSTIKEGMPCNPQRRGTRRCFLTAPSSTWNALLDAAGRLYPANVHTGIHANLDCKCKQTRDKQQQALENWNKDLVLHLSSSEFMTAGTSLILKSGWRKLRGKMRKRLTNEATLQAVPSPFFPPSVPRGDICTDENLTDRPTLPFFTTVTFYLCIAG